MIQSVSPFDGKYDTAVNRESAAEVLAQKAADAAAAAQQVEEQGEEAQRASPRRTTTMWEKAGKAAAGAVASSAGAVIAASITGKKSRAAPVASGITAVVGSIATSIGGEALGRFARGILGGLLR